MEDFWMEHRYSSCCYQLEPHYEHTYQLVFLLKGKILYQVGEKQYEVSKGGMILLNSLEEHTLKVLEYPYERYIIQINPLFFQKEINTPEIISIFIKRPENFSHLLALTDPIWNYVYDVIQELEKEYREKGCSFRRGRCGCSRAAGRRLCGRKSLCPHPGKPGGRDAGKGERKEQGECG